VRIIAGTWRGRPLIAPRSGVVEGPTPQAAVVD
jgi:hypothetical protein